MDQLLKKYNASFERLKWFTRLPNGEIEYYSDSDITSKYGTETTIEYWIMETAGSYNGEFEPTNKAKSGAKTGAKPKAEPGAKPKAEPVDEEDDSDTEEQSDDGIPTNWKKKNTEESIPNLYTLISRNKDNLLGRGTLMRIKITGSEIIIEKSAIFEKLKTIGEKIYNIQQSRNLFLDSTTNFFDKLKLSRGHTHTSGANLSKPIAALCEGHVTISKLLSMDDTNVIATGDDLLMKTASNLNGKILEGMNKCSLYLQSKHPTEIGEYFKLIEEGKYDQIKDENFKSNCREYFDKNIKVQADAFSGLYGYYGPRFVQTFGLYPWRYPYVITGGRYDLYNKYYLPYGHFLNYMYYLEK
jgi:hypothetical protein